MPDFPTRQALFDFTTKAAELGLNGQWYPRDDPKLGEGLLGGVLSRPSPFPDPVFCNPTFNDDLAALKDHQVYRWFAHHPNAARALKEFQESLFFETQAKRGLGEYEVIGFLKNVAIALLGYRISERLPDQRLALSKSARKEAFIPINRLLALFDKGLCLPDTSQQIQLESSLKTLRDEIVAGRASYFPTNISRDIRARLFVQELGRTFDTTYGGLGAKIVAELVTIFDPNIDERKIRKWLEATV